MYKRFTEIQAKEPESINKLIDLLLNKVTFLYFDMVNRTYGEEQFVVLNTTGKPLTVTENIKPKLLGELDNHVIIKDKKTQLRYYADNWENWELFFWQNKNNKHKTADKSFREFLRWIYIIEKTDLYESPKSSSADYTSSQKALSSGKYNIEEIAETKIQILNIIEEYFDALKLIVTDTELKNRFLFRDKELSQIQCFELLPLLLFVKEFSIINVDNLEYCRLKYFLKRRAKDENVSKPSITTVIEAIKIPLSLKEADVPSLLEYKLYQKFVSKGFLNQCEIYKFDVLNLNQTNQSQIEKNFLDAENMSNCEGNIQYIFEVLDLDLEKPEMKFPLMKFKKLVQLIKLSLEHPSNLMRRAMLTFGDYYTWHGHTVSLHSHRYSLGNNPQFYGNILNDENKDERHHLINFLKTSLSKVETINSENVKNWLDHCIKEYQCNDESIYDKVNGSLIKDSHYLNFMNNKMLCISYDQKKAYVLFKQKVTGEDSYKKMTFKN